MITAPDAVYVIIPCMKELGMSWQEIKQTPRYELVGLIAAMSNYNVLHSYDGYSPEDIAHHSKDNPQVRSGYNKSMELKAKYEARAGVKQKVKSFKDIL